LSPVINQAAVESTPGAPHAIPKRRRTIVLTTVSVVEYQYV
jgi:hypothetical protein